MAGEAIAQTRPRPPRAVAGIIRFVLMIVSVVLVRIAVPANPIDRMQNWNRLLES